MKEKSAMTIGGVLIIDGAFNAAGGDSIGAPSRFLFRSFFALLVAAIVFSPGIGLSEGPSAPVNRRPVISVSQYMEHPSLDDLLRGFTDYLKEKGIDAKLNVYNAKGDSKANEQIALRIAGEKPDLTLAISTPSAQACLKAAPGRPLLFSAVTDPVGAGLVEALDKPGETVTGMTDMSPVDRQIAIIRELQSGIETVGVLYNPSEANSVSLVSIAEAECRKVGLKLIKKEISAVEQLPDAVRFMAGNAQALYIPTDNTIVSAIVTVARICAEKRLPLYTADVDSVPRGAIAALAVDYGLMGRQTASMAERILAGTPCSALPVESLQDLRIHINIRAAELMGVDLPVNLLQAADAIYKDFPE